MKRLAIILIVLLCTGCASVSQPKWKTPKPELPVVNVPTADRQNNWLGNRREGSCVWATTISLLRWQGRYNTAAWIRQNYGNGEYPEHWAALSDKIGLRYAYTADGDVRFLEWACKTRRGCGITVMGGAHMVALVHLDGEKACILDNNRPERYIWVSRKTLIAEWKASHGWAITPVYTPAAPLPM